MYATKYVAVLLLEVHIERKLGWVCFFFVRIETEVPLGQGVFIEFMPGAYIAYHCLWNVSFIFFMIGLGIYLEKSLKAFL